MRQGDAVGERVLEPLRAEEAAVDADDLHPGSQARPIADHAGDDVGDLAVVAEGQAERVPGRDAPRPPRP